MRLGLALLFALSTELAYAQNTVTAGNLTSPFPTLESLSIEWAISGDDDGDSSVSVRYREVGATEFRAGLPLFRVISGSNEGFSWSNKLTGSLFALAPGAEYEIELELADPDGGGESRVIRVKTRPEPHAANGAPSVAVTPGSMSTVFAAATPGQILELEAGSYSGFTFAEDGTQQQPIVVRGASSADVVINGDVRLDGRRFVFLENLTVNGQIKLNNSEGIVVRGCTINAATNGIVAYAGGSTNGYFADNVVLGNDVWENASLGANGANSGEGIQLTGPGNVIAHNRVRGFRDCISLLEDDEAVNQVSIDIIGNDLELGMDDAIEADFSMGNVRVLRNRISSSFVGLSSQPSLGGPTYFVRNAMYNVVYSPFKLHRGSVGDIVLHNSVVKCGDALGIYAGRTISSAYFRNNLFLGGEGGGEYGGYGNGDGSVLRVADADESCSFDYDGFGSIGTGQFSGRLGSVGFSSLGELASSTSEVHAVAVDLSVFAQNVAFPSSPFPERTAVDLRLANDSAAVDRGLALANVNDGFAGSAPDLGAYELGTELPPYGPRVGVPVCGNGAREGSETCDDGNVTNGDGCNSRCSTETMSTDAGSAGPDSSATSEDAGPGDAGVGADAFRGDIDPTADVNHAPADATASSDATSDGGDGGCACRSGPSSGGSLAWLFALAALFARRIRLDSR